MVKCNNKYKDVTKEWLGNATPNSHKVCNRKYYKGNDGVKYNVDGKNVVIEYTLDEKETALWLANVIGGKIYMNPRINYPKGIETADYTFDGNHWDRKSIEKATSEIRAIDNAIKKHKDQARRFIIDAIGCKLSNDNLIIQTKDIFKRRNWVEEIIIKRDDELIAAIRKNKD